MNFHTRLIETIGEKLQEEKQCFAAGNSFYLIPSKSFKKPQYDSNRC